MSIIVRCPEDQTVTKQNVAELMIRQIYMDICIWEETHRGNKPGRIFLSGPLYYLLRNYHRSMIYNYSEPASVKLFDIPVKHYDPDEPDVLEYHLADDGKSINWKDV